MLKRHLVSYAATLVAFLGLDLLWLGVIARDFYRPSLEAAGLPVAIDPLMALGFYALYVVGVVVFAVSPALDRKDPRHAALYGGLFGLFAYATYELTNMATLDGLPVAVSLVDIPWGAFLAGVSALAGCLATARVTGGAGSQA